MPDDALATTEASVALAGHQRLAVQIVAIHTIRSNAQRTTRSL
jgi:hypothetical protein